MNDRWQVMRDYFASKLGQFVSFAYVNAKGDTIRGFGVVEQVLPAHVLLKTKTIRRYASFDYHRMPTLMRDMGVKVNHPMQAGFSPSCGEESEAERVEI